MAHDVRNHKIIIDPATGGPSTESVAATKESEDADIWKFGLPSRSAPPSATFICAIWGAENVSSEYGMNGVCHVVRDRLVTYTVHVCDQLMRNVVRLLRLRR